MKLYVPFSLMQLFYAASASTNDEVKRVLQDQGESAPFVIHADEPSQTGTASRVPAGLVPVKGSGKTNLRGQQASKLSFADSSFVYDVKQHPKSFNTNALVGDHVFMTEIHPSKQESSIHVKTDTQGAGGRELSLQSASGCLTPRFELNTDFDAAQAAAMRLIVFDYDQVLPDGTLGDVVFLADYGFLEPGLTYSPTEQNCLDPDACYGTLLYDQLGDGFSTGSFFFEVIDELGNRETILDIKPGNTGTVCEGCSVTGTTYWEADFGACTSNSGCLNFEMGFVADQPDEYVFALFDREDSNIDNPVVLLSDFEVGQLYSTDEPICLDPNVCWVFALLDYGNDGFLTQGSGIYVDLSGNTAWAKGPGDPDFTVVAEDSSCGLWRIAFGTCSESTTSAPGPSPTPSPVSPTPSPVSAPGPSPTSNCVSAVGVWPPGNWCNSDGQCCSGKCNIFGLSGGSCQ